MIADISQAFLLARRDLSRFWRYKYWLAGQVAMGLADIFIFALIFRGIVNPALIPDYLRFVMPGVLSLSIFISSFSIGREVGVELRREVTNYLVSLPVKRSVLVGGGLLGGVLRGLAYHISFLALAIIILGPPSPLKWAYVIFTTLTLTVTMSGLSVSLSTLTRDFNLQATIRSLAYYILFFISNVFYPESVARARLGPVSFLVSYSPLTYATNVYRWCFNYYAEIEVTRNALGLAAWSVLIIALTYKLYIRNIVK